MSKDQSASRNGEVFRQIADQFPAKVPSDDFKSEFAFAVKLDFRDWRRVLVALQATDAVSERQPRHWVYAAAEAHRHRLGYLEMGDRATESKHIEWMLDQIRDAGFSPTKACRWLGWVQAALYQAGIPLEELKAINRVASEQFERKGEG